MKLSFRKKLFLPLLISWLCLLGIATYGMFQNKALRLQERKIELSDICDLGVSIAKEYAELASTGAMPLEEAKAQALKRIKSLRYGNDGYFTIVGSDAKAIMHPIKPELDGKDMSAFKDAKGFYLFREIAAIGKTSGQGFIEYVWPRPGKSESVPKLSYVLTYKPWDWSFVAGVYLDDLTEAFMQELRHTALVLGVIGIALTAFGFLLGRSLEKSIGGDPEEAARIAMSIAEGDLTTVVKVGEQDRGSMLFSMKIMQEQLIRTLGAIQESAKAIASASVQIAQGNNDLSSRTEAQASSIEETAATMEELTSTVRQNTQNARHANQLAVSASSVAEQGGEVVSKVVDTMDSINDSSKKITDIIGVIDGIAFQTNILALNAAVEAARAGEQGRGFAVVAAEVRNLAQRSAGAAKEIKALIGDSVEKVDAGSKLVADAGETMDQIVDSVKKVTGIMAEIMLSSEEQTSGIEQVGQAIVQMDQATQQNAALVEQAAAASQALQDQAAGLTQIASVFKLDGAQAGASHSDSMGLIERPDPDAAFGKGRLKRS